MAVDVLVRLRVNDSELEQLEKDVNKLGGSIKKIEETSSKASKETANNFDQAADAADNLSGGVSGAVQQVKVLGTAAKTSGAAFRSALIATGIGAFVVVLGVIVDNWETIGKELGFINESLEDQFDLLQQNLDLLKSELKLLESEEKLLGKLGLSLEDNIEKQKKIVAEQIKIATAAAANLRTQLEKEKSLASELSLNERIAKRELERQGIKLPDDNNVFTAEDKVRFEQLEIEINKADTLINNLKANLFDLENPKEIKPKKPRGRGEKPLQDREDDPTALGEGAGLFQADEAALLERNEIIIGLEQDLSDSILNITEETNRRRNLNEKESAEARERIAEIEFQNKQRLLDAVGGGLAALSDIVGEQTSAGKALAVAGALIDTYAAIAGQLSAFSKVPIPGYAIAQAIATGLAGFAAVKNIIKVKVPNDKGSSQGGFSAPGGGVSAPSFNVVGTSGVNQLADTLQQQDQPLRAFVVGSDVTTQQELDHQINETATIS